MVSARPLIAVFGSSTVQPGEPTYELALRLGREVAAAGAEIMTGGYSGTMEACSRGAHERGGHVIGVTVELFEKRGPVNAWVKERVHMPDLYERLRYLVDRADAFIVLPGSIGTLTELFLTWTLVATGGRHVAPIVLLGDHWQAFVDALHRPHLVLEHLFAHLRVTSDAADAVRLALSAPVPAGSRAS